MKTHFSAYYAQIFSSLIYISFIKISYDLSLIFAEKASIKQNFPHRHKVRLLPGIQKAEHYKDLLQTSCSVLLL